MSEQWYCLRCGFVTPEVQFDAIAGFPTVIACPKCDENTRKTPPCHVIVMQERIAALDADNQKLTEMCSEYLGDIRRLQDCIAELRASAKWVPVSERLPEKDGSYIGCHIPSRYNPSNYIPCCDDIWGVWFEFGKFVDAPDDHIENTSITHWTTLPPT